ncbi:MAG: helicase-associated domain-containing protein [Caldilineaceae bacterium]
MAELDKLREVDLYALLPVNSVKKGFNYLHAILEPTRRGDTLTGSVIDRQRYQVEVEVTPTGVIGSCTCTHYGGPCRHIAALLLKWIHSPEVFTQNGAPPPAVTDGATPLRIVPVAPPPTQRPKELPAWLQKPWAERQQFTRHNLEQWLNYLRLEDLRALARTHGWSVKGTRKADVISRLLDQLLQPEEITRLLGKVDQEHRQALQAIALLGAFPTMQLDDMERLAKVWGKLKQHSKFSTYVRHLTEVGLVLSYEQLGQAVYGLSPASVPPAIARLLPPLLADTVPAHRDLEAATANATAKASGLQLADPEWLARTVTQLLVILEQTTPPLRPPLPRPYHEKFYPCLHHWDYVAEEVYDLEKQVKRHAYQPVTLTVPPPLYPLPDEPMTGLIPLAGDANRLEFLYHLMVTVGLLQPGSPVTVWPEVKEQFLRQTVALQQAILSRAYFAMTNWSELWLLLRNEPDLHLVRSTYVHNTLHHPQSLAAELTAFRTLVLTTCAWLPDDHWFKLADLFVLLRQLWPKFNQSFWQNRYYVVSGQNHRGFWHLANREGQPLDTNTAQEWEQIQGNFVRTLLSGPLHWAGLVDLYHEAGELTAVRFHGLGDLFWDRVESVTLRPIGGQSTVAQQATTDTDLLHIQGDQIAVAPALITAQAHSLLDRIASLEVAQPQQFVYRLDAATVQKSFAAGVILADLLAEWERSFHKPIPKSLKQRLTTWWTAYGQLRLYQDVTVIEFGDDYALTEMKAVTSLNTVLIAELSPRLVLVPKGAVATLAAELEKAGYTPQQTEGTE